MEEGVGGGFWGLGVNTFLLLIHAWHGMGGALERRFGLRENNMSMVNPGFKRVRNTVGYGGSTSSFLEI